MNQLSSIGFGSNAAVLAGYAQRANDRLGTFELVIENTGDNPLTFQLKEYVPSSNSYTNLGAALTIVARGTKSATYSTVSKKIGFFGSGNTTANISFAGRNMGDLRGAQIDLVASGHRGFGYDAAFDTATTSKQWGAPPDSLGTAAPSGGAGNG